MTAHPMHVNANTRVRWDSLRRLPCLADLKGKRVLDVAAGLGYFSARFAELGAAVLAVDIDAGSLAFCGRSAGVTTECLDIEAQGLPEGPFDLIFVGELLEHITNPEGFICRLRESLAPGGTLLLTTPAEEGLLAHSRGKRLGHEDGAEKHERDGFRREELRSMLTAAGLECRGNEYCIFYSAELFMQITKWFYLRKGKQYKTQADILNHTQSLSYRALCAVYPLIHPIFRLEERLLRNTSLAGHCHIVWAVRP